MSDNRTCYVCNQIKPLVEFATYKRNGTTRYYNKCRECYRTYEREAQARFRLKRGRKPLIPARTKPMKHCSTCGQDFPRTSEFFHRNKATNDGLDWRCKTCNNKRKHNPVVQHNSMRRWRATESGHRWHIMSGQRSYAMKKGNGPFERIYRHVVWERDGGICHVCHEPCDPKHWHLDHVIPLTKGGTHTYDNVAVSHPVCNIRKSNHVSP